MPLIFTPTHVLLLAEPGLEFGKNVAVLDPALTEVKLTVLPPHCQNDEAGSPPKALELTAVEDAPRKAEA